MPIKRWIWRCDVGGDGIQAAAVVFFLHRVLTRFADGMENEQPQSESSDSDTESISSLVGEDEIVYNAYGVRRSCACCRGTYLDWVVRRFEVAHGTVIPGLPDDLVRYNILPRVIAAVQPEVLWNLRQVNMRWREMVADTIEWSSLEIVRANQVQYGLHYFSTDEHISVAQRMRTELEFLRLMIEME
ncbi:hypothetical protein R1sor_011237 [Riccia sorocarpa]|uniref:F-box domain-containing protein n=1 Tax=Riccia sorocarpa TaxID=122646 RepID=A0ABD3I1I4_9MARC